MSTYKCKSWIKQEKVFSVWLQMCFWRCWTPKLFSLLLFFFPPSCFPTACSDSDVFSLPAPPSFSDLPAASLTLVGRSAWSKNQWLLWPPAASCPLVWVVKYAFYLWVFITHLMQTRCSLWEVTAALERCFFHLQVAGTSPLIFE